MWLMAPPFRQSVSVGRAPQWLRHNGYQVLRFWNNDVIENIDGVLETIAGALREVSPPDEESRVWHGSSSPSPRLPSGRLRPSSTGYGEGRGEGAFHRFGTAESAPHPARILRQTQERADPRSSRGQAPPQAGRGKEAAASIPPHAR